MNYSQTKNIQKQEVRKMSVLMFFSAKTEEMIPLFNVPTV